MKYIICGPAISENIEKCLEGASPAAGRFLNNLIEGLNHNHVDVEKCIYIASPILDKSIFEKVKEEESAYFIFKDRYILPSVLKYRRQVMDNVHSGDVVIFYNMFYAYFGLADKIKRRNAKPILLFADYTEAEDEKSKIRKIFANLCMKEFKKFDYVISLSNTNKKYWNSDAKVMIMRGGINFEYFRKIKEPIYDKKIRIMYAGLLSEVTGVDKFLGAIPKVRHQNIEFYISGKGPLEPQVVEAAKKDERIHYLGFLDEREYFEKLNKMNIFINPRNMLLGENRNNFPSKTLEYLATGRLIISTKFSGYEEFRDSMIWYDGTVEELANTIMKTINDYEVLYRQSYLKNLKKALEYDWDKQAKKIIEFE